MNNERAVIHSKVDEIVELRKHLGIEFKPRCERPYGFVNDMYHRGVLDRYIQILKYKLSLQGQQIPMELNV